MLNTLIASVLSTSLLLTPATGVISPVAGLSAQIMENETILSSESMDLTSRYPVESIGTGFAENILIALSYFASEDEEGKEILPDSFSLVLRPEDVFAFHKKGVLSEFKDSKIVSQESDFTTNYGYKVVAGLGGNGVCHLASLINKAALKAGLEVVAPVNHNFASIPGIEKEYGVSISTRNAPDRQNLYIKNSFEYPVEMRFVVTDNVLTVEILQINFQ